MSTDSNRSRTGKKARSERGPRAPNLSYVTDYLDSLELGVKPTVHVNGRSYSMALVTVDFGSPLKQVKLTSEQSGELNERLKKLAREVLGREANVRINHDGPNGVYWASLA